jgi:hypothetical protein
MLNIIQRLLSSSKSIEITRGSGKSSSDVRSILQFTRFSKVVIAGAADVHIYQGDERSVIVMGDDNIIPLITTDVIGDTLRIDSRGSYRTTSPLRVSVTTPDISDVTVSGSADVIISEIQQDHAKLKVSGSGDITASGRVTQLELRASGSGDIRTMSVKAETVNAKCSGSGDIFAKASKSASLKITGSGDINIYGKPNIVNSISKGSGDIRFL